MTDFLRDLVEIFDPDDARAAAAGLSPTGASPEQQAAAALKRLENIFRSWIPQVVTTRELANLYLEAGEDSGVYVRFFRLIQTVAAGTTKTVFAPVLPGIVQQLWVPPGSSLAPLSVSADPASPDVLATVAVDNTTLITLYPLDEAVQIDTPQAVRDGLTRTYQNLTSSDVTVTETIALLNIEKGHFQDIFVPFATLQKAMILRAVRSRAGSDRL